MIKKEPEQRWQVLRQPNEDRSKFLYSEDELYVIASFCETKNRTEDCFRLKRNKTARPGVFTAWFKEAIQNAKTVEEYVESEFVFYIVRNNRSMPEKRLIITEDSFLKACSDFRPSVNSCSLEVERIPKGPFCYMDLDRYSLDIYYNLGRRNAAGHFSFIANANGRQREVENQRGSFVTCFATEAMAEAFLDGHPHLRQAGYMPMREYCHVNFERRCE